MTHESRKAGARNHARLASVSNGGRTMAHRAVKRGLVVDTVEIDEGIMDHFASKTQRVRSTIHASHQGKVIDRVLDTFVVYWDSGSVSYLSRDEFEFIGT